MYQHSLFIIAANLVFIIGNGLAHADKAPAMQAKLFDYVKTENVQEQSSGTQKKARCCELTEWKIARSEHSGSGNIEITTITPLGKKGKKYPVVLWLHREGAEIRRATFIKEAEQLAANGIASLLLELPFKQPYVHRANNNAGDADNIHSAVIDARRALDWAASKPAFNIEQLAVVGQRFGAWAAALLTSVDNRIDAVILMSPPGKPSGWLQVTQQPKAKLFRDTFNKDEWSNYLYSIEPLDPERWVGFAAPAKLYFQFASQDEWTQTLEQVDLFRAATEPKIRQMYESDELLNEDARKKRAVWLKNELLRKKKA